MNLCKKVWKKLKYSGTLVAVAVVWTTTAIETDDWLKWDVPASGLPGWYEVAWLDGGPVDWIHVGQYHTSAPVPAGFGGGEVCVRACNVFGCGNMTCMVWEAGVGRRWEWDYPCQVIERIKDDRCKTGGF